MPNYKTKAKAIATKTAHVLPHVGAGLVLTSSALMIFTGIASHFNEKAAELVGKLGNEKLYYFTTAISILALVTAITYFALYLTKKTDKQLEDNNAKLEDEKIALTADKKKLEDEKKDLTTAKTTLEGEKTTLTAEKGVLEQNNETLKTGLQEINSSVNDEAKGIDYIKTILAQPSLSQVAGLAHTA